MLWAISGGAGFLGLHLARRLLADGHQVRTLDLAPLDDAELERSVEEVRGDIRSARDVRRLVDGAGVLVHAAAALPIQASRESIRSVNVGGTATPLVGVGWYGESKIEAEEVTRDFGRRGLEFTIVRPKTFVGPERLGVFEILFDWIRDDRRIYMLGTGENRYQLLAVEDLVDAIVLAAERREAAGETVNVGAGRFGTVRSDLQTVIDHAGSASRLTEVPARPAEIALRTLELLRVSPLAEWHYKTAHRDSFVDVGKAERLLGWTPRFSNAEALCRTYDWYLAHRETLKAAGVTHRVPWNQQALALLKKVS